MASNDAHEHHGQRAHEQGPQPAREPVVDLAGHAGALLGDRPPELGAPAKFQTLSTMPDQSRMSFVATLSSTNVR